MFRERAVQLHERLAALSVPLPGAVPYDNPRRLFVQKRYEGLTLVQFCDARHPHLGRDYWQAALGAQRVSYQGRRATGCERVAAGAIVVHTEPNTVEPRVDPRLELLHEDAALVALHKPAPLPVHPCGRFNKNTVTYLLSRVWPQFPLRPVHRLDANTTGVLVLAKSKEAARYLSEQFSGQRVQKRYLVEVCGQPPKRCFGVDADVTPAPGTSGSRSLAPPGSGLPARTTFCLLGPTAKDHALLEARPNHGRTNQIRLHLASLGLPIVGDRAYPTSNPVRSEADALTTARPIHLHAWCLRIRSPASGELLDLEATPPQWARDLVKPGPTLPACG